MIALVIISSVVFVVVMFVVFIVVSDTDVSVTVGGVAIAQFLLPVVQVNAASSIFWVEESGYGTWELAHYVDRLETNTTPAGAWTLGDSCGNYTCTPIPWVLFVRRQLASRRVNFRV